MNIKDLLEEFFVELGYQKLDDYLDDYCNINSHALLRRLADGAWTMTFKINGQPDIIFVSCEPKDPLEVEIKYNQIHFKKIDLHDPNSLDYLAKVLKVGKSTVDKLVQETGSRYVFKNKRRDYL